MKNNSFDKISIAIKLAFGISACFHCGYTQALESTVYTNDQNSAQKLYVEATINGTIQDNLLNIRKLGDIILVRPSELRLFGIQLPGDEDIVLNAVDGLKFNYDHAHQKIALQVQPTLLKTNFISVEQSEKNIAVSATGMVANYEIAAASFSGNKFSSQSLTFWSDLRPFTSDGVGTLAGSFSTQQQKYTRFDTSWVSTDQENMRSVTFGDTTTGAQNWSRSVRIGGLKISSDFATRPDLITFPTPSYSGSAEVPTTVDILLNNVRTYSTEVGSGPFVISNAPTIVGAGQVSLVVRDLMGRDVVTTIPLYVDNKLLKKWLTSYSVEAGFLRKNYGRSSFDYSNDPVLSGVFSKGLSDILTIQTHGELTGSLRNIGIGSDLLVPSMGLFSSNASLSRYAETTGFQLGLGHQYLGRKSSYFSQCQITSRDFRDLATLSGGQVRTKQCSLNASVSVSARMNLSGAVILAKNMNESLTSYITSLSYRLNNRSSLVVNGTKSSGSRSQYSLFAGLNFSFDSGISSSMNARHTERGFQSEVGFSKSADYAGGIGYAGQVSKSDGAYREFGRLDYLNRYGNSYIVANKSHSNLSTTFGTYGGMIFMDNNIFFSRSVNDSFAVVSTNGIPDIPVYSENRIVGKTDSNGYALVSNLIGYNKNNISIDLSESALGDYSNIDRQYVFPKSRSGTKVAFPLQKLKSVLLSLVDEEGVPLKAGSPVVVNGGQSSSIVGYGGKVYIENANEKMHLAAQTSQGKCHSSIQVTLNKSGITNLGDQTCQLNMDK